MSDMIECCPDCGNAGFRYRSRQRCYYCTECTNCFDEPDERRALSTPSLPRAPHARAALDADPETVLGGDD